MSPALDNIDTGSDQKSIAKQPQYSSTYKKWRNLVLIAGGAAASLVMGIGVGIQYEDLPAQGSANRIESNILVPLLVKETSPGGLSASGYQIIAGVMKTDGTIFTKSGAIMTGPLADPIFLLSGAVLEFRGSFSGTTLTVSKTGSGNINVFGSDGGGMCFFDTDAAGWTVCNALNGAFSCSIATAGYCPR